MRGRVLELQEAEDGGGDLATLQVNVIENATVEWYHEKVADSHEFILCGYWEMP